MAAFCRKYGLNAVGRSFARQYAAEIKAQRAAKSSPGLIDEEATADEGTALFDEREYPPCPVPVVYDLKALYHQDPERAKELERENVLDLSLGAYLVSPNEGDYSLERLAARYGVHGERLELEEKLGGAIYERLRGPEDNPSKLWEVYTRLERPLTGVLAEMEKAGILVDRESLKAGSIAAAQRLDRLQAEIYQLAGESFNVNSPKQLGEILLKSWPCRWKRKQRPAIPPAWTYWKTLPPSIP